MPPPIPPPRPVKRGPPPPPMLDAGRVTAALAPVGPALKEAVEYMAATGPDRYTDAACRITASTLADIGRASARRDTAGVERWAGWLCDFLPSLPDKMAELHHSAGVSKDVDLAAFGLAGFCRKAWPKKPRG